VSISVGQSADEYPVTDSNLSADSDRSIMTLSSDTMLTDLPYYFATSFRRSNFDIGLDGTLYIPFKTCRGKITPRHIVSFIGGHYNVLSVIA